MLFNSFHFAYFFLILFPVYWALKGRLRLQNAVLLTAAYYFYGSWNWKFLSLLILSTVMDYACGLVVDRCETQWKRKLGVGISMALNLGLLGYFKYCNFFLDSFHQLLTRMGVDSPLRVIDVVLPIGISFYTFQSMAYVIDVYRRDIKPTKSLLEFATFVSFFPHLVAGPIMRPTNLLPQVSNRRRFDLDQFYQGVYLIFWGLTKKVVVADNLAILVDDLFGRYQTINGGMAVLAIYAFAFQIYCDFSGYTDAARGVAKCLGFELTPNFNLPYFSTSPREFWQRWHISLSTWLRDYLYIPLGGSRGGRAVWFGNTLLASIMLALGAGAWFAAEAHPSVLSWRERLPWLHWAGLAIGVVGFVAILLIRRERAMVYRNLLLTMVLGGLWHGASWTFLVWGLYQGLLLIGHRMAEPWLARVRPVDRVDAACWKGVRMFVTFHLVCLGWLVFRADSITQVGGMLDAIWNHPALPPIALIVPFLAVVVPLLVIEFAQYVSKDLDVVLRTPWYVRSLLYTACFYAFVLGGEFGGKQFLYFQF